MLLIPPRDDFALVLESAVSLKAAAHRPGKAQGWLDACRQARLETSPSALIGSLFPKAATTPLARLRYAGEADSVQQTQLGAAFIGCFDPVQLQVGQQQLQITPIAAFSAPPEVDDALSHWLSQQLSDFSDTLRFVAAAADRGYLLSDNSMLLQGVSAPALDVVTAHGISALPLSQTSDQRSWRRFATELEMGLFEHPFNQQRQQAGQPAVSGFWLWGGEAEISSSLPQKLSAPTLLSSDDPLLLGAARYSGVALAASPLSHPCDFSSRHGVWRGKATAHWLITLPADVAGVNTLAQRLPELLAALTPWSPLRALNLLYDGGHYRITWLQRLKMAWS
ncbi:MAG: hypothetical protein HQL49_04595 [Gammaproteobacteria bacterium]|nr:hypothetical protein [Gammaproteobacteria bacterium]